MFRRLTFLMLACAGAALGPLQAQTVPNLRGDVNVDGQITAHDALSVLSSVVGKGLPAEYRVLPNGDADANGEVTAVDALVILGYVVGKNSGAHPVGEPVYTVSVTPGAADLVVGRTVRLEARVEGSTDGVTWRSGSPHVAPVDAAGLVTAFAEGSATITAVLKSDTTQRADVVVRVLAAGVASLSVTPSSHTLAAVGSTVQLAVHGMDELGQAVAPQGAAWTSSNAAVARVDAAGVVTAVGAGNATITAASNGRSASATVHVNAPGSAPATPAPAPATPAPAPATPTPAPATPAPAPAAPTPGPVATVTLSPTTLALRVGQTGALSTILKDASATVLADRSVAWSSSNPAVATVSSTGVVTAIAAGTATVTGTSEGQSAGVTVQVSPPASAPVATVTLSPTALTLQVGQTGALSSVLKDATSKVLVDRTVAWSSSVPAVATVSSTGVVTAVAAGISTVTGSSEGKSGSVTVQVSAPPPAPVAVVNVSPSALALQAGQTGALSTILKDASANVLADRIIAWSSSAPTVATVSSTGVVTAVAAGSATVTVTSEGKSASVSVAVTAPEITAASVVVSPASHAFTALAAHLQASVVTKNAQGQPITGRTVSWSSSNSAIAEVDAAGKITARGNGTATITATADGKSATLSLAVQQATSDVLVSPATATLLSLGASVQLSAAVKDANNYKVTSCTVAWASVSPGVATVSSSGSVVAQGAGTTLVTAACGAVSDTALVEVRLPVATPGTYTVPASIAADCSIDVTAALHAWIASVPDNSTLVFGSNACYNIDGGLQIENRHGLTFNGNGATFRVVSRGTAQRANWTVFRGSGIVLRNMTVRGASPAMANGYATYDASVAWQALIRLMGTDGALVENVQGSDSYGDFVTIEPGGALVRGVYPLVRPRNITVRNSHFERAGRQALAITDGENIVVEGNYFGDARMTGIDIEPAALHTSVTNVRIEGNRFGRVRHGVLTVVRNDARTEIVIRGIRFANNIMTEPGQTCVSALLLWAGSDFDIVNNQLNTLNAGVETKWVERVLVQGNTVQGPRSLSCARVAGVYSIDSREVTVTGNTFRTFPQVVRMDELSTGFSVADNVLQP